MSQTPARREPLRATVTAAPAAGSRWLRVRFHGGRRSAPAALSSTAGTVPVLGDLVRVEMAGRTPIVVGGL